MSRTLSLFGSRLRPCPYLPGREERNVAAELAGPDAAEIYDAAVRAGFRRSHDIIYRPACTGCEACVPVRVRVDDFTPRRSLARNARRNADLVVTEHAPPSAGAELFDLFRRYQSGRHAGGGMDGMGRREFENLMMTSPVETFAAEFRDANGTLVAVMLADHVEDGLSAVYSFFDPQLTRESLGTYMVLWLIERAHKAGLHYIYLGYWIARSQKMAYKARFRPLEALHPTNGWISFDPAPKQ
jgi:arginyl-tRNA--protein-N-Asp/Glu arginylyltransferase